MKYFALALGLLSLSACNYSNTFNGTYNGASATMSAYSKNINKYCVALTIYAGSTQKNTFISAQSVFDPNDFLKPMSFNTKGVANCSEGLEEYLVGNRNTNVLSISVVSERESAGVNYCRSVSYQQYQYQEDISFEMRKNGSDEVVGNFQGKGQVSFYTDRSRPVSYGPIYYCGGPTYPRPYPGPYPRPYPGRGGISITFGR